MSSAIRRRYIDWARALAILVMIEAHTVDAWTRAADRRTSAFRDATILGGFAAPLFLWLAGVSLVLSAESVARRTGSRRAGADAICRRGLEIFLLAFLFRLQALIVTPGGDVVELFRVDILNIMGPAIVASSVVWGVAAWASRRRTDAVVLGSAAMATAFAMLTPIIRASVLVDRLPIWLQLYVRPTGDMTMFTAFPWAGFVFAGGAAGALIAAVRDPAAEARLQAWLAAIGASLIGAGLYAATLPSLYSRSAFWTSSPAWFAIRVGILMVTLAALCVLARLAEHRGVEIHRIERFGRTSLFIYWIHVELVYGYASWLLRGRLPVWGALVACALFSVLMYGAVVMRDRVRSMWRARRGVGRAPQPAAA
ncbi:MAG: hypothetical protein DMF91_03170 [Acidobacteria bacterium]|nr:MAG: hypothetical protein DMF91_03170 [Acidobacteriota bacterium]